MAIAVVGAPASGKSSVGRRLAQSLDLPFVDVDHEIEHRSGKSIPEMFADEGEAHFRTLEREVTLELLDRGGVVSLGGGAVLNPDIRAALVGHDVVWLQVSVTHATRRVGMNVMRPLLLGDVRANLQRLMDEREPLYRELATVTIDTNKRRVDDIVAQITERLT
ncbi:shikimate kinase [Aestuariimicrobium ganziense]|uniref:shikimate kinase n=1 Tax=Aestuariimicrobium ganziense TaxID=2773677 RepID=UPI0019457EBD|nr:shikimate kinase [Aestuariimicrobium ganziense]